MAFFDDKFLISCEVARESGAWLARYFKPSKGSKLSIEFANDKTGAIN